MTDGGAVAWSRCSTTHGPPETYVLADRLDDPAVAARAAGPVSRAAASRPRQVARSCFTADAPVRRDLRESAEPIALLRGEQSNTSIRFGDALILKLFRRLQFGPNPDVEVG